MNFASGYPHTHMSYLNLALLRISTTYLFNHSALTRIQAHLVGFSSCYSVIPVLFTGCGRKEMNAHFMNCDGLGFRNALTEPQNTTEVPSDAPPEEHYITIIQASEDML